MEFFIRFLLGFGLASTGLFLILLVLIQRGRGGGLSGAFGGAGGQSAFGTKAGDVFTKITVAVAGFWIVLCIVATNVLGRQRSLINDDLGSSAPQSIAPLTPAESSISPQSDTDASPTPPTTENNAAADAPSEDSSEPPTQPIPQKTSDADNEPSNTPSGETSGSEDNTQTQ